MRAMKELTPKQARFVAEYLKDLNAKQAATRAGYSEKTAEVQGCRLLRNVQVAQAVEVGHAKQLAKAESDAAVSKAWVLSRLKENAERAMQAVPVTDNEGNETGEYTWQPNAANRSLELIGKELGMFVERKRLTIEDLRELSTEELLVLMEDIVERLKKASEFESGIVH
jgi:phage terminase small subunit